MELRHLRYFCAVAEQLSFTAAAKRLNVSQSGVSGQVRELEQELGLSLLKRDRRSVALTFAGLSFLREAREILAHAERMVEAVQHSSDGRTGTLKVGLCGPVTDPILPGVIRQLREERPGVVVSLRERAPAEQVDALLQREIDLGFSRSIPADKKHLLGYELFFREPVIAAVPNGHTLAAGDAVAMRRLATERLVLYQRDGAPEIFDSIVAMCRRAKFSPRIADTPGSWQSVLTMVEAGEGIGLVPACVQHLRATGVTFVPLGGRSARVDAWIVWRRTETSAIQERFLELLRAFRPKAS